MVISVVAVEGYAATATYYVLSVVLYLQYCGSGGGTSVVLPVTGTCRSCVVVREVSLSYL
jgi:hypothetical protein